MSSRKLMRNQLIIFPLCFYFLYLHPTVCLSVCLCFFPSPSVPSVNNVIEHKWGGNLFNFEIKVANLIRKIRSALKMKIGYDLKFQRKLLISIRSFRTETRLIAQACPCLHIGDRGKLM